MEPAEMKVDFEKLRKVYKAIKQNHIKQISFEFLVGSCFPQAYENIKEELRLQYTKGYTDGLKEKEKGGSDET